MELPPSSWQHQGSVLVGPDHKYDEEHDPTAAARSEIERFGCHIPRHVARLLEAHPDAHTLVGGGASQGAPRRPDKAPRRLSWSDMPVLTRRLSSDAPGSTTSASFSSSCGLRKSFLRQLSGAGPGDSDVDTLHSTEPSSLSRSILSISSCSYVPGRFPPPRLGAPDAPAASYHRAAILFVDISGFTRLSTLLDVESLSNAINAYFENLIHEVEAYGGDVLKFCGDAFLAEWRENDEDGDDEDDDDELGDALCEAALCGASIVQKYSDYSVPTLASDVALLNVHCGVGVGKIAALHVGNDETRREFLILGSPIDQVSGAEAIAKNGELAASPEAIAMLSRCCSMPHHILEAASSGVMRPEVIAREHERFFEPAAPFDDYERIQPRPYCLRYVSPHTIGALRHQMSLYVHPAARLEADRATPGDRQHHSRDIIENAEIRSVYTIFIKPQIIPRVHGDEVNDSHLLALLNDIMGVTCRVLGKFQGHLRQFVVDDKGVVLIATFGQRGATFPNMVAEKGLPCTIAIHDALKIELNVDSHLGATFGKAYVGIVGGVRRHEFAILGSSVNLAARLMSSKDNPGILVDDAIRTMASNRFDFLSLPPVEAKGYADPVPIFEPQAEIERQWNKLTYFVGRENDLKALVLGARKSITMKRNEKNPCNKAHMALIQAHSGFGKSSLALQAMDKIRRLGGKYQKEVSILKNVCRDGEERVPFCVFRQIILHLLDEHIDEEHCAADTAVSGITMIDLAESNSFAPTNISDAVYLRRIRELSSELNYPEGFADLLAEKMLGLSVAADDTGVGIAKMEKLRPDEAVDFVVDAILSCTSHAHFAVLALDDVQWIDSLSWKVVEGLVRRGKDLLVICISRPIATSNVFVDPAFLQELREDTQDEKYSRLIEIELLPFTKSDVRALFARSIGCEKDHIDDEVCNYLYDQTGGMPYFVQEVISNIIRKDLLEWQDDGSVCWRSGQKSEAQKILYSNMNDLLLHRLDSFDPETRILLQVCAVLGFEFSLSELLIVECPGRRKKKRTQRILDALHGACKERVLIELRQGGSTSTKGMNSSQGDKGKKTDERTYVFSHAVWRNCVLGTMLSERQRDLHGTIATMLEADGFGENLEPRLAMRVFGHWRDSGDLMKATRLAQKIGQYLSGLLLNQQSMDFYQEALKMWKRTDSQSKHDEKLIAGIRPDLLDSINADNLDCLARVHIAIAKNASNLADGKTAGEWYQKCDMILTNSSAVADMKDRSVFFALYSGLFALTQSGYIAITGDGKRVDRVDLAKRFVAQAKIHGDPVHTARALAMEALSTANLGRFQEAVSNQKQLEGVYSAKKLSAGTIREYATDRSAQSYGYSVLWYEVLDRHEEAQHQIDFILKELMPIMPPKNVHNSLMILFPVISVLKDKGMAQKAAAVFRVHVFEKFYEFYSDGSTTFFFKIYKTLKIWLQLASDVQEGRNSDGLQRKEMEDWVLSAEAGSEDRIRTVPMCAMGRDVHCIVAEILWMLRETCNDKQRQKELIQKGHEQAQKSLGYTNASPGSEYARRQSEKILQHFSTLHNVS